MHPMNREKCSESAGGDCIGTVLWWELPASGEADKAMKPGCKLSVRSGFWFSQYRGVSIKEQALLGIYSAPIDALTVSRYSQAQINHLIAYANPRHRKAIKSSGSRPPCAPGNLLKAVARPIPCHPPESSALTAENLYITLPGGSGSGPARFISQLQRRIGGYRPL
jgi:hypothetical protein